MDDYEEDDDLEQIGGDFPVDDDNFVIEEEQEEGNGYEGSSSQPLNNQTASPQTPSVFRMKPLDRIPGSTNYACELCNKQFQVKHTVYRHIKEVHRKMIIFVDDNDKEIESLNKPAVFFPCDLCGETFNTRRNLDGHMKSHSRMTVNSNGGSNGNNKSQGSGNNNSHLAQGDDNDSIAPEEFPEDEDDDDEDDDIGDHDGIDEDGIDGFPEGVEDNFLDGEDDVDFQAEEDTPSSGGCPYRCPYGICPQFFTTKDMMQNHLKSCHGVRLELVPLTAPRVRQALPPPRFSSQSQNKMSSLPSSSSSLSSSLLLNNDKRFPCTFRGCQSAFTRRDRLNLHIRTKHNSSTSASASSSTPLKVKLPSIQNDVQRMSEGNKLLEASRLLAKQISASRSNGASYGSELDSQPLLGRNGKPTIHPKKYPCDFPGCDKAYTKGSHVKRHKLSAHPQLFQDNQGSGCSFNQKPVQENSSEKRDTQESLGYFEDGEEEDGQDEEFPLEDYPSPSKKSRTTAAPSVVKTPPVQSSLLMGSRSRPRR